MVQSAFQITFGVLLMKKSDLVEKNLFGICPFATTQQLLLGKWLIPILNELNSGKKRFSELQRVFGISQTTLSKQLKILEEEGLIKRKIYPEVPPRVEYSLSELGQKFKPVLDSIEIFGEIYIDYLKNRK